MYVSIRRFQKFIQRTGTPIGHLTQSIRATNALQTKQVFLGDVALAKKIPELVQQFPERLIVTGGKGEAFYLRKCRFYFREFHGAVVDENHVIRCYIPRS